MKATLVGPSIRIGVFLIAVVGGLVLFIKPPAEVTWPNCPHGGAAAGVGRRSVVPCSVAAGSALPPMTVRSRPRGLPNGLGRRSSTRRRQTTLGRCVRLVL